MSDTLSRVVCIEHTGGPEQMQLTTRPVGEPGPGEIRIRHHAIGLNYIDIYHRTGLYPLPLPLALGMEGAGVVEAVGAGVTHLRVGDRAAYAANPPGSYCDVRVMPAMTVCRLPEQLPFDAAAALMLKGLTAQYLLRRCRPAEGLESGDFVLFHAAAGGVGLIACQWARALGLRLIGTAGSDEKCALAQAHGAEWVINYRREPVAERVREITSGRGVKVVYDSVGRDTWESSLDCLAPFGLMVSFGNASGPVPAFAPAVLAAKGSLYLTRQTLFTHLSSRERTQAMADDLFAALARDEIQPPAPRHYPLSAVQQAHRDLEARLTTGASVLLP